MEIRKKLDLEGDEGKKRRKRRVRLGNGEEIKKEVSGEISLFAWILLIFQIRPSVLDNPSSKFCLSTYQMVLGVRKTDTMSLERGRAGPNSGNVPLQNHSRCLVFYYTTYSDQMLNQTQETIYKMMKYVWVHTWIRLLCIELDPNCSIARIILVI